MAINVLNVDTMPFKGQKPGTSGLRKKVTEFTQPHYMENFIQCTLLALGNSLEGCTLVVGGDGRFGVPHAVNLIIQIAAANKVSIYVIIQCYSIRFIHLTKMTIYYCV